LYDNLDTICHQHILCMSRIGYVDWIVMSSFCLTVLSIAGESLMLAVDPCMNLPVSSDLSAVA
jgi:hypothetical protein